MGPTLEIPVVPLTSARYEDLRQYARIEFRDTTFAWLLPDGTRPPRASRVPRWFRRLGGRMRARTDAPTHPSLEAGAAPAAACEDARTQPGRPAGSRAD